MEGRFGGLLWNAYLCGRVGEGEKVMCESEGGLGTFASSFFACFAWLGNSEMLYFLVKNKEI